MQKDQNFKEKKIAGEKVFSGQLLQVYKDEVELPSGKKSFREFIKHPGASVVIPYLGNNQIMLVNQFRYPVNKTMLELPAGKIDPGESYKATMIRELFEETGLKAETMIQLAPIHTCIGYSNELLYLFWASGLEKTDHNIDTDEIISLNPIDISDALELIYTGEISDGKTIVGIFWADKILKDKKLQLRFNINI